MRLSALIHVVQAVRALTQCERVTVLGSAALLLPFPDLGEDAGPLTLTRDADLLISPCDEETAHMVHEAIGRGSLFEARHGYHVDMLSERIEASLPRGWHERLQVEPVSQAFVLDPVDLCAVKLFAGRDKDLQVVGHLVGLRLVSHAAIRDAIATMPIGERARLGALRRLGLLSP